MSALDYTSIDAPLVIDSFLLLLIGVGPKIALVPYIELTEGMDVKTKARVSQKMITTAALASLFLIVFGSFLTRLLHFSTGALGIAGGIILVIIAVSMVLKSQDSTPADNLRPQQDPMKTAVFPLAIPYLLNPAGVVLLVTISAEVRSWGLAAILVGLLVLVLLLDVVMFRWANRVSEHLNPSRMLVTEKVFGFLLAALGVQLVLVGLADLRVIGPLTH